MRRISEDCLAVFSQPFSCAIWEDFPVRGPGAWSERDLIPAAGSGRLSLPFGRQKER